ncbi:MAG: lysylphosphatidylglycerol synthase transmembrane domain-containing protein [Bacteroidota bacterium]|nr:lysylphosphatidylglycerol synthase transmembrane domain-containing protein [Bacteroidota bacterium]
MNRKNIIKYSIFAIVGAITIYFIQKSFNFEDFLINLKNSKWQYVLISVLMGVFAVLLRALRWQLMLNPLGFRTSLSNAYHATMSGYLVNLGIPRSGEIYRCAVFSKSDKVPLNTLIGSVVSERIIDMLMLGLVLLLSFVIQFDLLYDYFYSHFFVNLNAGFLVPVLLLGLVMGIVFLIKFKSFIKTESKIGKLIVGFMDGLKAVFTIQQPVLFIVYTLGIWVSYLMMTYFILQAFDFSRVIGLGGALSTLVFSTLGVIIPAPAGIATISSVQLGLTEIYSFSSVNANSIGIVLFFSNITMMILAGSVSFFIMMFKTKV